jgi:hypothetical protein
MILEFVYRGRSVVIDDLPAPTSEEKAASSTPAGHDHGGGHPDPEPPTPMPMPDDHGGHDHGGHAHGRIRIRIDTKVVFADRVSSGFFFMTHELPFQNFTRIDELAKAVIDHSIFGVNHGDSKEPK